jgi:monofunctional biosynthetic peptidoglycan transglycosylase
MKKKPVKKPVNKKAGGKFKFRYSFLNLFLKLTLSLFFISIFWVLLLRWVSPPATLHMIQRRAQAGEAGKDNPYIRYTYVPIRNVSAQAPLAMVAAEDQRFMLHNGFEFKAMQDAFITTIKTDRKVGGSTISQQVAKNVFLWHGRSYLRKGIEAYFTFLIEVFWGKKRIMEVYLNIAEMGNRIFGVEAASRTYFRKPAADLNANQAAQLAAVLPNPIRYKVSSPSAYVLRNRVRILRSMVRLGGKKYVAALTD